MGKNGCDYRADAYAESRTSLVTGTLVTAVVGRPVQIPMNKNDTRWLHNALHHPRRRVRAKNRRRLVQATRIALKRRKNRAGYGSLREKPALGSALFDGTAPKYAMEFFGL